jgi:L-fuculose-phosphate aldolase
VVVASQLGTPLKTFSNAHLQDLLNIKQTLGIPDPRIGLKECELCDNPEWRPGVTCAVSPNGNGTALAPLAPDTEAEALVQAITDQIMAGLK